MTRHQQHGFMDISDGDNGLAILNDTLRDYEVVDPDNGVIAQSVVRGVPLRIPVDNRLWMEYPGDESAQSLGTHTVRYGLLAHAGGWETSGVAEAATAFCTPLRLAQIGKQQGSLPCSRSFLRLKADNLILSAFKKAEDRDSAIVRVLNTTGTVIDAEVSVAMSVAEAHLVNLNEDRLEQIEAPAGQPIRITVPAKKIMGIELVAAEKRFSH